MRTNGFPEFPDVQPGGGLPIEHTANGGVEIIVNGVGQPVNASALQAAMGKCGRFMVSLAGSPVSNSQVGRINQALLQNAECMRSHGVPQFPDPVFPGSGHFGHMSPTARAREAGVNIDSPAFKAAVKTCGQILSAAMNGSRP
jgi:hypothetical protein